jgi:hypothetical protein
MKNDMYKYNEHITIRKASGETEAFDPMKLMASLMKSGADQEVAGEITEKIQDWLTEGATTKGIYARAYALLKQQSKPNALKYNLKQALLELGTTGYPFEKLVGEIFRKQGYAVEVGIFVDGRCIRHEMDVVATNQQQQIIVECKHSQSQGKHVGIQVPLYVRSRVDDIILKRKALKEFKHLTFTGCVVTNTRFSDDSIAYARCAHLKLLGWDYPSGGGLKDLIEKLNIFPVTILKTLTKLEKQQLADQGIVTLEQLRNNLSILGNLNINPRRYRELIKEMKNEE